MASNLTEKSEENQVNTLVYSMGDAADDILITLGLTAENKKKYKPVTEKFTDHLIKKRNTIFERAKFNQRVQESGKSVDAFITDLYSLAETCSYGGLQEEMIRDRIVVGLQNAKLSERLQLDSTLTLEKAVNEARQSEAVKRQQAVVQGNGLSANEESNLNVDVLHRKWQPRQKKQEPTGIEKERRDTKCGNCGKVPGHPRSQCPAKDVTCHNCQKKGHYKIVCRSLKTIGTVIEEEDYFLGTVDVDQLNVNDGPWKTMLKLDGVSVIFKLDTGVDVTVVPEHIFKKTHRWLKESKIKLTGPGQQPLDVCGVFEAQIQSHEKATTQNVYVIRGLKTPLLGRPAIEALSLVSVVQSFNSPGEEIFKKYPTLFQGLGKLTGEYNIKLREGAQPYAVTTPRRIALPLLPKVKEELERLEFQGVISRVEEPTDWCAPIVVVPKQSGSVRLCVDLTKLNDSVRREKHMLPSVEQILAQLSGAKVFSKIDANSGFHQIPLAKESALLTTFITPFGRFCYNRLPFGITSAPEHFQRRMSETMDSLEGTLCIMDDICQLLIQYCRNGWPDKSTIKGPLKLYWPVAAELTVQNGLLMRGCRTVIPASQRMEILEKLHTGHLGIVRCRQRANQSVWWPGIGRQLQELVDNSTVCRQHSRNRAEPMISTELPSLPWQKVATDLLDLQNRMYLLVVDYYS